MGPRRLRRCCRNTRLSCSTSPVDRQQGQACWLVCELIAKCCAYVMHAHILHARVLQKSKHQISARRPRVKSRQIVIMEMRFFATFKTWWRPHGPRTGHRYNSALQYERDKRMPKGRRDALNESRPHYITMPTCRTHKLQNGFTFNST